MKNIVQCALPAVVSINRFNRDSDEQLAFLRPVCEAQGAKVALSEGWAWGGEGTMHLARAVLETVENFNGRYTPIYDWNCNIETKVEAVAKEIYSAGSVELQAKALADIKHIEGLGLGHLSICIPKTQKSFSDNETLIGCQNSFELTVREFKIVARRVS